MKELLHQLTGRTTARAACNASFKSWHVGHMRPCSFAVRCVSKAYRIIEAALSKGMEQSDAWNATSVEWVRAAKVSNIMFSICFT